MVKTLDRLTIKSELIDGHYTLICMSIFGMGGVHGKDDGDYCYEYCSGDGKCEECGIQEAFDRLAAYEDTGLTPEEIIALRSGNICPERRGRWLKDRSGVIVCSECGEEHEWEDYRATYCDNCGAKMDGKDGEEK